MIEWCRYQFGKLHQAKHRQAKRVNQKMSLPSKNPLNERKFLFWIRTNTCKPEMPLTSFMQIAEWKWGQMNDWDDWEVRTFRQSIEPAEKCTEEKWTLPGENGLNERKLLFYIRTNLCKPEIWPITRVRLAKKKLQRQCHCDRKENCHEDQNDDRIWTCRLAEYFQIHPP